MKCPRCDRYFLLERKIELYTPLLCFCGYQEDNPEIKTLFSQCQKLRRELDDSISKLEAISQRQNPSGISYLDVENLIWQAKQNQVHCDDERLATRLIVATHHLEKWMFRPNLILYCPDDAALIEKEFKEFPGTPAFAPNHIWDVSMYPSKAMEKDKILITAEIAQHTWVQLPKSLTIITIKKET